jgi:hypothetical protein
MTVTNSHAELPERDWTEHFPESPPDFRDGPDFRESIAPFIAEPETYDSLFTDGRAEARGGINFRLAEWWRSDSPEPGKWETLPTVGGYLGLRSCVIEFLLSNEGGGWQITYLAAREPLALGDEEDDSGNQ